MIRALVADDEKDMRLVLKKALEKLGQVQVLGEASNGLEAVALAKKHKPDCIFLDVEMPECDGVSAARQILDITEKTKIIFITAYREYMPQAFEMYAFDYMVKPFKFERLKATVEKLKTHKEPDKVMLKHKDGFVFINPEDILIIQRENRSTAIITGNGKFFVTGSLSDILDTLPKGYFMRSHKSYIINHRHIKKIYPYGRWTYVCEFPGITENALITANKLKELEAGNQ